MEIHDPSVFDDQAAVVEKKLGVHRVDRVGETLGEALGRRRVEERR